MREMISLAFMQNAFISVFLISIISGIVGSLVVINRMSFIAGGIAHGAYGGIGLAIFFGISPLFGATIFSIFLALIVAAFTLKDRDKFDSVIGAMWSFGMAIGIIFADLTPGYRADLMSYLFGSILSVNSQSIIFMIICDTLFFTLIVLFYRQFLAISFDSEFAKLRGINVAIFYYVLIIMITIGVVASMQTVGLILVIALICIPPYIAQKFSSALWSMMINSFIICMVFCNVGLILSYKFNLASGAVIIIVASIGFFIATAIFGFKKH